MWKFDGVCSLVYNSHTFYSIGDSWSMVDESTKQQIVESRNTAQSMGDAALEAISQGDIGLARTAARQAAQWARIVIQLESGEKQIESGEERETLRL